MKRVFFACILICFSSCVWVPINSDELKECEKMCTENGGIKKLHPKAVILFSCNGMECICNNGMRHEKNFLEVE